MMSANNTTCILSGCLWKIPVAVRAESTSGWSRYTE
jgi:hypothetical protein